MLHFWTAHISEGGRTGLYPLHPEGSSGRTLLPPAQRGHHSRALYPLLGSQEAAPTAAQVDTAAGHVLADVSVHLVCARSSSQEEVAAAELQQSTQGLSLMGADYAMQLQHPGMSNWVGFRGHDGIYSMEWVADRLQ